MRPTVLMLCLVLGGCAAAKARSELTASSKPAAPAAATVQAPPLARAAQAQAQAQASGERRDWWKDGPVTREKINAMCWMKYERGRKDMPVEKRADLVDECVRQALKEHPPR